MLTLFTLILLRLLHGFFHMGNRCLVLRYQLFEALVLLVEFHGVFHMFNDV